MSLWFDLKYAWRLTKRSLGYSLMCASVIALGVGLTLWSCSIAYGLLWPPGFEHCRGWYSVQLAADTGATASPIVDAYTYQELLKRNRSAQYLGAFEIRSAVLSEGQISASLRAGAISPRLLAAVQAPPRLGRTFDDTDTQPGAAAVAILSFDTWQNYFAADPAIIGKTARIDSTPVQIVGVMPKDFFEFQDFEVWLPLRLPNLARPGDAAMMLSPLIVVDKKETLNTILNEMKTAVEGVNSDYPNLFKSGRHVALIPVLQMYSGDTLPILLTVLFLCGAVLLLGCVDISLLFFTRLIERSRELALRTALGASRSRLLWQCVLESGLVVPLGLVGGWLFAAMVFRWGRGMYSITEQVLATGRTPYLPELRPIDLLTAIIAAVAIWLFSTLIPAWRIANQDAAAVLAGSGKGSAIRVSNKSAGLLVGLQVLITCLVLVVCGNMVLGVKKELSKPTGLDTAHIMLATYPTVFNARLSEATQRLHYWEDLTAAIQSKMPDTEVAFSTAAPTMPDPVAASIEGQQRTEHQGTLTVPLTVVSDNYFEVLGLSRRSGRLFDSTDNSASLKVAVVDEPLAARYWPHQDVLGKRVQLNPADNGPWLTIIGVVSAVAGSPYDPNIGVVYQPLRQAVPSEFRTLVKLPNTAADSRSVLRAAAFAVDRDLPLHNLQTLDDFLAASNLGYAGLIPSFTFISIMTAMLAAFGLFGLISRSVAQRTQEVGIRRALGATSWQATSMFLRQGAVYLCVGMVGVGLGTMVANLLSGMVTNILDQVVLVTLEVVLLMGAVIFAASHLPSRRAMALEPGDALRYE